MEEIPVEVVTEPPPPSKSSRRSPSRRSRREPQQQEQKQKPPPPPPPQEIEKPAFDAPKAESKSKSEVDAPELKELKTPKQRAA